MRIQDVHTKSIQVVIAVLYSLFVIPFAANVYAAELDRIGTFDFPTSGSPAAQAHFIRGVGFLHSFGLAQAQDEFRSAQEIQPDFAMAYWGEAFTYQHPFFGQKDAGPGEALMRLGATSEERLAKAPTEREKGFLRAAEAYALTVGTMPQRRIAWMNAMADLYAQFPDDNEVKAFYTASMLAGATCVRPEARAHQYARRRLSAANCSRKTQSPRCSALCNSRLR